MKFSFAMSRFKTIALNLAFLFVCYFLTRILFYFGNSTTFEAHSRVDILKAFLVGVRFDIAAICLLNIVYILLSLVPFQFVYSRFYQWSLKIYFIATNFLLIGAQVVDTDYFKFTGARMTFSITAIGGDAQNQIAQLISYYWQLASVFFILLILGWIFYRPLKEAERRPAWMYGLASFITIALTVVGARGGLNYKVLAPSYAFTVTEGSLGILALNTPFTILKTDRRDRLQPVQFFPDQKTALEHLVRPSFNFTPAKTPQNVMIVILESFATEFWGIANNGDGYTPFLDSLAKKGLFFRNGFANGRKSIEAVPSMLLGLPGLMERPLAKSKFQFNEWNGLGTILNKRGYTTAFFHGAKTGSMHFDAVTDLAGFKNYYGLEKYPNPEHTDGNWGIFDEPYLQYVAQSLKQIQKPFLAVAFTLSSHQPYTIPKEHQNKFRKGPTPLHEAIGYTDFAVQQFIASVENEPWFKNTLFIFTGDHTQMSPSVNYATTLGVYMVPMMLYHPSMELKANTEKVVQHTDVFATVLDFLGIKEEKTTLFGRSVFQNDGGRAVLFKTGNYLLVRPGMAAEFDMNKNKMSYYSFTEPNSARISETADPAAAKEMELELKSFVQYFNNGLNENSLYKY